MKPDLDELCKTDPRYRLARAIAHENPHRMIHVGEKAGIIHGGQTWGKTEWMGRKLPLRLPVIE